MIGEKKTFPLLQLTHSKSVPNDSSTIKQQTNKRPLTPNKHSDHLPNYPKPTLEFTQHISTFAQHSESQISQLMFQYKHKLNQIKTQTNSPLYQSIEKKIY